MNARHRVVIEQLRRGEPVVDYREGGNSMVPLIHSREPVTLHPVDTGKLEKGDMVFVRVRGRIYTHKVLALRGGQAKIGNNRGGVNGWTQLENVYGIVTEVNGRVVGSAREKVLATSGELD